MSAPRRVFVQAFGCQMNVLDGEIVLGELAREGWQVTYDRSEADLVIFNTCSVRAHSENKVWSHLGALREKKRARPDLLIGVMGCMAQRTGEEILDRMPHVDIVCGTRRFDEFPAFVRRAAESGERTLALNPETPDFTAPHREVGVRPVRHRAFVAVMRGCDHRCTYCIVPATRGAEISRPVADVVDEVRRLRDDGVREVTLLGQNINTYGKQLPGSPSLVDLLIALDALDGIDRVRFITSNPMDLEPALLEAMGSLASACEYLHFPAQSGNDRVLRRMGRLYTVDRYRELAALARRKVPGIELSSDFIVGFPGETEEEFEDTMSLVREIELQNIYVFKYSVRPDTAATHFDDDVPEEEKRRRNNALLALQLSISERRNAALVGTTQEVLVDGPSKTDASRLAGRTRTDRIVIADGLTECAIGRLVPIRIESATALCLYGVPADPAAVT